MATILAQLSHLAQCSLMSGVYRHLTALEGKPLKQILSHIETNLAQLASTVVPTKSDSDVIFCLQLLSKTLTFTLLLT